MKRTLSKNFIILLILIQSLLLPTLSQAFDIILTDEYQMGEGDSKITARNILLNKINQTAARRAGIYIQSDKTLTSNKSLSKQIKTISASITKTKILSEKLELKKDKRLYLVIKAKVSVNDKVLKDRINALNSSKKKDNIIKSLSKKNQYLERQIRILSKNMKKKNLSAEDVAQIIQKQNNIIKKINENNIRASELFKKGTLLEMAEAKDKREKARLESLQTEYNNFWNEISRKIKPELHSIKKINDQYMISIWVKDPFTDSLIRQKLYNLILKCAPSLSKGAKKYKVCFKLDNQEDSFDLAKDIILQSGNKYLRVGIPGKTKDLFVFGITKESYFMDNAQSIYQNKIYDQYLRVANKEYIISTFKNKNKLSDTRPTIRLRNPFKNSSNHPVTKNDSYYEAVIYVPESIVNNADHLIAKLISK